MKLITTAENVGLQINDNKTEYMILNRREVKHRQDEIMKVENHNFKGVSHFNYLGLILTNDNDIKVEIDTRLKKGNNCYYGLGKLLSSKAISNTLKVQIYVYTSKSKEIRLEVFKRTILIRIFRPCKDDQTGE